LIIGLILPYDKKVIARLQELNVDVAVSSRDMLFWVVVLVSLAGLAWAIWQSKRDTVSTN
jgi:soluble P-type ATPase